MTKMLSYLSNIYHGDLASIIPCTQFLHNLSLFPCRKHSFLCYVLKTPLTVSHFALSLKDKREAAPASTLWTHCPVAQRNHLQAYSNQETNIFPLKKTAKQVFCLVHLYISTFPQCNIKNFKMLQNFTSHASVTWAVKKMSSQQWKWTCNLVISHIIFLR